MLWRTCTYSYTVTLLAALVAVLEHHHKHLHAFLEIWMVQCLSIKSAHSTSQVWAALTGFQQTDKYISTHAHRVIYTAEVHLGVCIGYTHAYKLCRQPWVHSMENITLRISDKVWISDYWVFYIVIVSYRYILSPVWQVSWAEYFTMSKNIMNFKKAKALFIYLFFKKESTLIDP